jgi:uncharacterized protein YbjT (DUF2867 family)
MNRKAVVAGATGLIGKELVHLLLDDPTYKAVTLLLRRPTGLTYPKLQEKVINFDRMEQAEVDLSGADVFCTLGTTIKKAGSQDAFRRVDYTYPLTLGRMAKDQGAKQFIIVTSLGANPSSRTFYLRVKGELEEALRALNFPSLQIFRPSFLLGNREEFRLGERIAALLLLPFSGLMGKYRPIQARSVAKAMVHAALSGHSGIQFYESNQMAHLSESSVSQH